MSRRPVHGLILAAGASTRMGRPKALLEIRGEPVIRRLVRLLRPVCAEVVVVVGRHAAEIAPLVDRAVVHAGWRRGMRSSLRAGLRALPPGPVLLTHCDRPLVRPSTLSALASATDGAPLLPFHDGRPGHPVRLPAWLRPRLLAPDDIPLRDVLRAAAPRSLPVRDAGVLRDANTPEAFRFLVAAATS